MAFGVLESKNMFVKDVRCTKAERVFRTYAKGAKPKHAHHGSVAHLL